MLGIPGLLARVFYPVPAGAEVPAPLLWSLPASPWEAGFVPQPLGNGRAKDQHPGGDGGVRVGLCTPGRTRPGRFVPGLTLPAPALLSAASARPGGPGAKSHVAASVSQLLPAKCGRDLAAPCCPAGAVLQSPHSIPWLLQPQL